MVALCEGGVPGVAEEHGFVVEDWRRVRVRVAGRGFAQPWKVCVR